MSARLGFELELQISVLRPPHAGGLYMPMDTATNLSKGFAFVEFATPQEANAAREQTHGGADDEMP